MKKCKNSVIFFFSLYKKVPSGVILQPKIYQEIELFFFYGKGREEIINHKEATRMRSCKTEI